MINWCRVLLVSREEEESAGKCHALPHFVAVLYLNFNLNYIYIIKDKIRGSILAWHWQTLALGAVSGTHQRNPALADQVHSSWYYASTYTWWPTLDLLGQSLSIRQIQYKSNSYQSVQLILIFYICSFLIEISLRFVRLLKHGKMKTLLSSLKTSTLAIKLLFDIGPRIGHDSDKDLLTYCVESMSTLTQPFWLPINMQSVVLIELRNHIYTLLHN